jgi:hypothetical protein
MPAREQKWTGMVRTAMRLRKRALFEGGGYMPVPVGALEEPNAVKVKSAAIIEDSEKGWCHFHLIVNTTPPLPIP